jgi:hypothetical protein
MITGLPERGDVAQRLELFLERLLTVDTVEKLFLIAGFGADSVSPLIWEIDSDDGRQTGSPRHVVL